MHKHARVPIAIGKYIDIMTYDITPMDNTCAAKETLAIILVSFYDSYRNTYNIWKGKQEFMLLQMTLVEV